VSDETYLADASHFGDEGEDMVPAVMWLEFRAAQSPGN
jgi:hypothetical protein